MSWNPPRRRVGRDDASPAARRTLVDKVWDAHVVGPAGEGDDLERLTVDRILLHEHHVGLAGRSGSPGTQVAAPWRIVACSDQQSPTTPSPEGPRSGAQLVTAVERLERTSASLGIPVFGPGDHRGGIVNVVAAEQGMVLPGALVAGADGHVSTHGAFGAVALVIADHEVADVVASGQIVRRRPAVVRVSVSGSLAADATAKDLALWLLGRLGRGVATGRVLELGGSVVRSLSMEGRMTVSNLMIECGADAVVIAPDTSTIEYLAGRPFAPEPAAWDAVTDHWSQMVSDPGAGFDADVAVIGDAVGPHATWGTNVAQVAALDGVVPPPDKRDPHRAGCDAQALIDQDLTPGQPMGDISVDQVFIGSCANARIEDLRAAAEVARGGRAQVPSWVVPGSWPVKREAESEGLHRVFIDAGFEWRDPGCSLCIGANGDAVRPGARLASTANRSVRGLVGPAARVHLMSPASAAATAMTGKLTSARMLS